MPSIVDRNVVMRLMAVYRCVVWKQADIMKQLILFIFVTLT